MKIIDWLRELVGVTVIEEEDEEIIVENEEVASNISSDITKQLRPEDRVVKNHNFGFEAVKPDNTPLSKLSFEIFMPQDINDCPHIADKLKKGCVVILNFEYTKTDEARHVYFFVRGCVYALNGVCQQVGKNIFLFSPGEIEFSSIGKDISLEDTFSFTWGKHKK